MEEHLLNCPWTSYIASFTLHSMYYPLTIYLNSLPGAPAAAQDDDPMNKLKGQKIVQCRVCKGDHWTTKCPYKDKLAPIEVRVRQDRPL